MLSKPALGTVYEIKPTSSVIPNFDLDIPVDTIGRDAARAAVAEIQAQLPGLIDSSAPMIGQKVPQFVNDAIDTLSARLPQMISDAAPEIGAQIPALVSQRLVPALQPEIDKINQRLWTGVAVLSVAIVGSTWWLLREMKAR